MTHGNEAYLGNPNLKPQRQPVAFSKEQVSEYVKCSKDPVYFMENYMKIVQLDRGLIAFDMWDFQRELVDLIHNNRFVIAKFPRQTGKSTTVIGYILWYVLFQSNMSVAVLANKLSTARELLSRLQLAYEYLPRWLQQGIKAWNKSNIELENGSKIIAAATSGPAIRGGSYNLIFLDEFAHVPKEIAEEFFSSVYPTISSGKTTKVLIVSTPKGMNMYYKLWVEAKEGRNSYKPIEVAWNAVPGRDEAWRKQEIANLGGKNGGLELFRIEYECEFIGSTATLIAASTLRSLAHRDPIWQNYEGLELYAKPEADHIYAMCVDTSRGVGLDYNAFTVVDITEMPYRIVAKYKNNKIAPMLFPNVIYPVAEKYNTAYVLVEINDIGGQVADLLHHDLEYDNLVMVSVRGRKGQCIDGGFGRGKTQFGVKTTAKVKAVGCSVLKSMIEEEKLIIEQLDIMDELCTFIKKGDSYQAETGAHDDLVMTLVLFAWLSTQTYFKDLTNVDIRAKLYASKIKDMEENMLPAGFFGIDGAEAEVEVDSEGNVWTKVDSDEMQDKLENGWSW